MKPSFHATVLIAMLLSAARGAEEPVNSPLEGRWTVISARRNGGDYTRESLDKFIVTIKGDEIRFNIEGTEAEQAARFVVRPDKQPAEIDFLRQTRSRAWNNDNPAAMLFRGWTLVEGKAIPAEDRGEGIYKIENDKLTLCWRTNKHREIGADGKVSQESQLRPTVFQSHLYYGQNLFVLERAK